VPVFLGNDSSDHACTSIETRSNRRPINLIDAEIGGAIYEYGPDAGRDPDDRSAHVIAAAAIAMEPRMTMVECPSENISPTATGRFACVGHSFSCL
jgi:hypothetical protein